MPMSPKETFGPDRGLNEVVKTAFLGFIPKGE